MCQTHPLDLLRTARTRYTQKQLAEILEVDVRTVRRWEVLENDPPPYLSDAIRQRILPLIDHTVHDDTTKFKFIDLFAGIGGIRLGFEAHGGQCVFTSEWNKFSQKTYLENFPESSDHNFVGDITEVDEKDIPDHDVLLAGFPCQPFSIAGVSKKNSLGRSHGFACDTQGTLFFDVARIIDEKRPKAFLLENVKNLCSHDKGKTFEVIKRTLVEELGYQIFPMIIDAKGFVPQHRERIYIVGFLKETSFSWDEFDHPGKNSKTMKDILHTENGNEESEKDYTIGSKALVNDKYTLSVKLWKYLRDYAAKHKKKGNGFGFGKVGYDDTARTLSARYYKDGSEILIDRGVRKRPRRLTPRECARLMGYEDSFFIPVSDTQAYKQFGNSVVVPVVTEIAKIMTPHIIAIKQEQDKTQNQSIMTV